MALRRRKGLEVPPSTVTAELAVTMRKPTPLVPLMIRSRVADLLEDRAWIEGTVGPGHDITATARGLFVIVKPGHPAAHGRW
jgi:hypothetical protein